MGYFTIPKEPVSNREEVSGIITRIIIDSLEEEGKSIESIRNYGNLDYDIQYQMYTMVINDNLLDPSLIRWIKKSVYMSYATNIIGLSAEGKRQLAIDMQKHFLRYFGGVK